MESGLLLLLLLLAAPWGQDWAASGHASEEEMAPAESPSVRREEPGKCHETSKTCDDNCSSNCPGSTDCGQECQQGKEDFYPWIGPDPTTNCVNKCRDDSNFRGSRKCCQIWCQFCCPQPVPAGPGTFPKKKVPHTCCCCCNSTCSSDTDCPNCLWCCLPPRRGSRFGLSLLGWSCNWCHGLLQLCYLAPDHSLCKMRLPHFAYFHPFKWCRRFKYGVCKGDANNFLTLWQCRQICQRGLYKR